MAFCSICFVYTKSASFLTNRNSQVYCFHVFSFLSSQRCICFCFGADLYFPRRLKCKKNQEKSIGQHAIHYDILTKLTLFKKYLRGSENLVVKLASGISNIEIGEAVIVIPQNLIEFIDKSKSTHSIRQTVGKFPIKSFIFDTQQKIIGEIFMDFEMTLYDRVLNEMNTEISNSQTIMANVDDVLTTVTKQQQQINGIENNMNHFNLDLKKKKHQNNHSNNEKSNRQERMPSSLTKKRISIKSTNISSSLLNYLTGRPLHAAEEMEAVQAMASTSPTESLINQLTYDLNGLYLPKRTTQVDSIETNVLKKIDCLRIHIYELCLTRAGIREILSKANAPNEMSFASGSFTVSIDFDSILSATKSPFEQNNATCSSKVARIFDTSIETIPPGK